MRILIVDDHPLFGDGLRFMLRDAVPDVDVVCCISGDEALRLAAQAEFDLVLLDWNLGTQGICGEELLAALKAALPSSRLVVVSGENGAGVIRRAIEGGAAGFVPKQSTRQLLFDALTLTAHGGIYLPMAVLEEAAKAAASSDAAAPAMPSVPTLRRIAEAFPQLTPRHGEVLDLLARGMSNKHIARQLDISDGTVKQHLNTIFRELGVGSRTEAVYLMARHGVRFD